MMSRLCVALLTHNFDSYDKKVLNDSKASSQNIAHNIFSPETTGKLN